MALLRLDPDSVFRATARCRPQPQIEPWQGGSVHDEEDRWFSHEWPGRWWPVELDPGAHTLVARARGHRPQRLRLDLSPEQLLEVDVDLEATTQRYLAWGTLITAGVFAVGSLTTGLIALDAEGDAQDLEARLGQGLTDAEFSQHDRLRERRDDIGDLVAHFLTESQEDGEAPKTISAVAQASAIMQLGARTVTAETPLSTGRPMRASMVCETVCPSNAATWR